MHRLLQLDHLRVSDLRLFTCVVLNQLRTSCKWASSRRWDISVVSLRQAKNRMQISKVRLMQVMVWDACMRRMESTAVAQEYYLMHVIVLPCRPVVKLLVVNSSV